ncbi:uncharacterized protein BDR25DRAFT_50259 [Lindgomyces ingoldianus]|uniref:Uncharacterized protein n=1 Tax=Lindgomyces ingoldianus TaxID=673940 RepID=A0ACB6QPN8_9PLEO|nr:uncharacterized protein BDR25DRAFT_50259 [Lindgomyces ingoldianus]KAF2468994.1 hypothetical protein BDR25DRAFT_50259 [Lindgomyces ingoldianus]
MQGMSKGSAPAPGIQHRVVIRTVALSLRPTSAKAIYSQRSKVFVTVPSPVTMEKLKVSVTIICSFLPASSEERRNVLSGLTLTHHYIQYPFLCESPYIGDPNPSVDTAWHILLANMSLRITLSELSTHSQTSVGLLGGGYLAWLGVYHELHCIKFLRHVNYRDHYFSNATQEELRDIQVHADHCLDTLRNAAMCHSDTESLTTFVWELGREKPLLSPQRPFHRCVDWEGFVESIVDRVVSEEEMGRLRNPLGG